MTLTRLKANNKDVIIPHTNNVKPLLIEAHKAARVFYCYSKIEQPLGVCYTDWYQTVHVLYEKWFFITQEQLKMYLTPSVSQQQKAPVRRVKNKHGIRLPTTKELDHIMVNPGAHEGRSSAGAEATGRYHVGNLFLARRHTDQIPLFSKIAVQSGTSHGLVLGGTLCAPVILIFNRL